MKRSLICVAAFALALAPVGAATQDASQRPENHAGPETNADKEEAVTDTVELMRLWLENFPEGDWDAFPGEISPDFTLYLPFVPAGVPNEIRGRENVRQRLIETAKGRSKLILSDIKILKTEDPELLVATAKGAATMTNGKPYRNNYVIFTRIRDGVVLEHTEYLNPLAILEAAGD